MTKTRDFSGGGGSYSDSWFVAFGPVADSFRDALGSAIVSMFGPKSRARDLDRNFAIQRAMASRIHRAAFFENAIESILLLPGHPTMNRFINEVAEMDIAEDVIGELKRSYEAYVEKAAEVASNQQELIARLTANAPTIGGSSILRKWTACFRASVDLESIVADATSGVVVFLPNAKTPGMIDLAQLMATNGLRRYQTDSMGVSHHTSNVDASDESRPRRVDGRDDLMETDGILVRELSSACIPPPRKILQPEKTIMSLLAEDLPIGEPVDLTSAVIHRACMDDIPEGERRSEQVTITGRISTKLRIVDYVVHKDVWKGIEPELRMYQTGGAVPDGAFPEEWTHFELPHEASLRQIETEELMEPLEGAPLQLELLKYCEQHMNLDFADYRVYRLAVAYPLLRVPIRVYFIRR